MIDPLDLLRDLISTVSVTSEEEGIIHYLKVLLENSGFETEITKSGALIGLLRGNREGQRVVFDSHVDTVPVGEVDKWSFDPFKATIKDGLVYGRGASDMKGGLAASISAISEFRGGDFPGELYVSLTPEEERFEGILSSEVVDIVNPDFVVICESTDGKLNIGQRGRAEITLTLNGKSCHSASPNKGKNAIWELERALSVLSELEIHTDDLLGEGILVPVDVVSYPYPGMSVLPERVTLTLDRRTLTGETKESVLSEINTLLSEKGIDGKASISHGVTTTYNGSTLSEDRFFPAWKTDIKSPIVELSRRGLESENLFKGYSHYGFCTNGSGYSKFNIPLVGYGPGREESAHTYDESIEIESLLSATRGMRGIIKGLLGIL